MNNNRLIVIIIGFILLVGFFGAYVGLCHISSAIGDNPASLLEVDFKTGNFKIKMNGRIHNTTLAELRMCSESQNQVIARILQEEFHGRFSAYVNETGEFQIVTEDANSGKEISFNTYIRKLLGENCERIAR